MWTERYRFMAFQDTNTQVTELKPIKIVTTSSISLMIKQEALF